MTEIERERQGRGVGGEGGGRDAETDRRDGVLI